MSNIAEHIHRGPVAIKNVAAFMAMTMKVVHRAPHLPGFGVCHAPSGYGKTWASIFAQNKTNAIRVEVGDSWTRRTLLAKILGEFGESCTKRETVSELADRAINALGEDPRRPLLVDEADRLVDRGLIEILRELQESSGAPVILIGEEKLPAKLLTVERVHNRVLDWFPAQPCDLDDTRELAKAFAPKLKIADDLLDAIRVQSGGRARRIVTNLEEAKDIARNTNLSTIDLSAWGAHRFHTGEPPQTRHVEAYIRKLGARAA
ncbi:AAA family ATPase [Rhodopseudomonas palustris]|uniref:ATP-binding protein n=1 Tax=Rhodopseudomonas palustris TaxID=1076 RepID=A0A418V4D0_RHOPL|nr:ATP-binding protein [Rhodopseudomonas palustris]RJF70902.1 ATP-binding protein [Rhodopseudomonas palustris]